MTPDLCTIGGPAEETVLDTATVSRGVALLRDLVAVTADEDWPDAHVLLDAIVRACGPAHLRAVRTAVAHLPISRPNGTRPSLEVAA